MRRRTHFELGERRGADDSEEEPLGVDGVVGVGGDARERLLELREGDAALVARVAVRLDPHREAPRRRAGSARDARGEHCNAQYKCYEYVCVCVCVCVCGRERTEHVVDDAREARGQWQRDHAVGIEARVRVAAAAAAQERAHLAVKQVHDDRPVAAQVALPRLSYEHMYSYLFTEL